MPMYCGHCGNEVDLGCECDCAIKQLEQKKIREFETGATRDSDEGKLKYFKFFSPIVLRRLAEYMHKHRKLPDGTLREPDNWQQGIAIDVYMDSMFRHFMDVWSINRGCGPIYDARDGNTIYVNEALCAVIFNAMGYLYEMLKPQEPKYFMPTEAATDIGPLDGIQAAMTHLDHVSVSPCPPSYGWEENMCIPPETPKAGWDE